MVKSSGLSKEKDGSMRFCINYRKLNVITKKDVFPYPELMMHWTCYIVGGAQFFSTLDLAYGYWQVLMDKEMRKKQHFLLTPGYMSSVSCHLG